jgi:hypothetical protein
MAEKGHVLISTVETNSEGIENDTDTETKRSNLSNSVVAQSILVPNDTSDETSRSTNYSKNKQKMVSSRMAFINNFRRQAGLEEHLITVLNDSTRRSTRQVYDLGWNKWETWCAEQKPRINALEYNPLNIAQFLSKYQHFSPQSLNGLRSAIASVFNIIHADKETNCKPTYYQRLFQSKEENYSQNISADRFGDVGFGHINSTYQEQFLRYQDHITKRVANKSNTALMYRNNVAPKI